MKTFIGSCVALAIVLVLSEASEYAGNYKKAVQHCLEEQNLSKEEYLKLVDANDSKVYCVYACVNKKVGAFDGMKFNAEKMHEATKAELTNEHHEYTETMKAALDKCLEIGNNFDGDACMKTEASMKCVFEDSKLVKVMTKADLKTMVA